LDSATKSSIITLPVDEVKSLRHNKVSKKEIQLAPGTVVQVDGAIGDQLDIEIVFDYPDVSKAFKDKGGTFGPFGLLVLADKEFQEQSALYFHISYRQNEGWITQYVSDPGRSTLAKDIDTNSYSAPVNVLSSEDFLSARILVDCSVIESFVQGGRMSMNTRSYPTVAYGSNAYVYLFNNGTTPINLRSLEVWQMHSASNDESI
jgi:sucrose-6-phosphate hydrolase SacC (GH32 family)